MTCVIRMRRLTLLLILPRMLAPGPTTQTYRQGNVLLVTSLCAEARRLTDRRTPVLEQNVPLGAACQGLSPWDQSVPRNVLSLALPVLLSPGRIMEAEGSMMKTTTN